MHGSKYDFINNRNNERGKMKRQFRIERKELELLKDMIKLYTKYNKGEKADLYDQHLIYILEKNSYLTAGRREWRKHK